MAELSLVFPPAQTGAEFESYDDDGRLSLFVFDVTQSETHTQSVDWTEHPTESGANVTDHGTLSQPTASYSGTLSRTSIATNPRIANEPGRLEQAVQTLFEMVAARTRVTIFTPFRVLEDYRLVSVSVSRSVEIGQAAEFTLDLKKITTVEAQSVDIPPALVKPAARAQATKETSAGTQTASETSADAEAGPDDGTGRRSWGKQGLDFLTGL